jgi:hypothetical protein
VGGSKPGRGGAWGIKERLGREKGGIESQHDKKMTREQP